MITEERMSELLASAAGAYEPPADGVDRVIEAAAPPATRRRRLPQVTWPRLSLAAVASVFVVAAGLAVTDGAGPGLSTASRNELVGRPASGAAFDEQYANSPTSTTVASGAGGQKMAAPLEAGQLPAAPARTTVSLGGARVVSTGSIVVEVRKGAVDEAVDAISTSAVGAGGYVSNSRSSSSGGRRSGAVTIRVPADRFAPMADEIAELGRVVRRDTNGQDVSAEYADVEAQLRVLTTTRGSLLEVLAGARVVGDILAVQDRLDAVQTRIEQLQGRQKLLDDQVSLATISVALVEPPAKGSALAGGASAWRKALDGFTGTWAAVVARSGTALAVVLVASVLLAAAMALVRWARRAHARLVV